MKSLRKKMRADLDKREEEKEEQLRALNKAKALQRQLERDVDALEVMINVSNSILVFFF